MAGFPALPSPANPYVGAAAEASSGAAHLAASLREAADQQAALKQQADEKAANKQHQDQTDLANALKDGAVPVSQGATDLPTDSAGRPTLQTPSGSDPQTGQQGSQAQNPDYSMDPQRIALRGGVPVYYPTPQEKAAVEAKSKKANESLDETNSFPLSPFSAQAANEMYGDGTYKAGQRIPTAQKDMIVDAVKQHLNKSQLDDTNSITITQDMSDRLKPHGFSLKPGARVSLEKAAELKDLVGIAEPKEAVDKSLKWLTNEDDKGNVTSHGVDPYTGAEVRTLKYPGEGKKRKDPDAEKPPSPAQFRQIEATKQQSLKQAATTLKKDLGEANYRGISDQDAVKTANETYRSSLAAAQRAYEAEIGTLTGKDVQHNPWADAGPQPTTDTSTNDASKSAKAAPAAAAQPAANGQQTGKKTATIAHVRAYAAKKYPNDPQGQAKAIKEFQQYGYSIGGQ